ncbi:MAG: hypothetical protein HOH04_07475 [Rhodospirillaceae bacterium]|jgi:hypothetical protein|nr:hypothetical protein [Rhodospirillaceae bacterium]
MSDTDADFEKADVILADALQRFQADGVSPYVYGMALMEIGIASLVSVGEDTASIAEQATNIAERVAPALRGPR